MSGTRWVLTVIALGCFARLSFAAEGVHGVCASTPAAALFAAKSANGRNSAALDEVHGYRIESVRWDPLLRQSWAVIRSCDHLEEPSVTRLMDAPTPLLPTPSVVRSYVTLPLVRAGDMVRLWKSERYARIEMVAISEENGAVGTRVRVRLATSHDMEGQSGQPQYLAGVVRGPDDVEMEP